MIDFIKDNEMNYLPIKYSFIGDYDKNISEFAVDTDGHLLEELTFIDEVITLLISQV